MLRAFPAYLLLLLLTSCASVPWEQRPADLPGSWRHYQLFVGPHAMVLARDAAAAREVHHLAATMATAFTAALGRAPQRGLLLALSAEDPLPIAGPKAYVESFRNWQQTLTGIRPPPPSFTPPQRPGHEPVEFDPALALHLLASGIPKDDHQLDLPPELVAAAGFVAILPTDSCLATTCDTMFDAACAAQGISKLTVMAAAVVVGHPATLMGNAMAEVRRKALYEACLPAMAVPPADVAALRQRLDLTPRNDSSTEVAEAAARPLSAEQLAQVHTFETQQTWPVADGSGFVVRKRPPPELQAHLLDGPWQVVVDMALAKDDLLVHVFRSGRAYQPFSCARALPTRSDAERFELLLQNLPHQGALVVADEPECAAALVAAHAFFVRGQSAETAVDLARRCGGASLAPALAQLFTKQPPPK